MVWAILLAWSGAVRAWVGVVVHPAAEQLLLEAVRVAALVRPAVCATEMSVEGVAAAGFVQLRWLPLSPSPGWAWSGSSRAGVEGGLRMS